LNNYLQRLKQEKLRLIVIKDNKTIFTSRVEGMRPLFEAIDTLGLLALRGSIIIDKIIGKAAALLISYVKAQAAHCMILSEGARAIFDTQGVKYSSEQTISQIKNKTGTDVCPYEKAVENIEDPGKGYETLLFKLYQRPE